VYSILFICSFIYGAFNSASSSSADTKLYKKLIMKIKWWILGRGGNIRDQTWRIIKKFFWGYWRKPLKATFNLVFRVRMTVLHTIWLHSASSFFIPLRYTYFSQGFILLHHQGTLFLDVGESSFKTIAYFRTGKLARSWKAKAFALSGNTQFRM
jgi:hypothetical protein